MLDKFNVSLDSLLDAVSDVHQNEYCLLFVVILWSLLQKIGLCFQLWMEPCFSSRYIHVQWHIVLNFTLIRLMPENTCDFHCFCISHLILEFYGISEDGSLNSMDACKRHLQTIIRSLARLMAYRVMQKMLYICFYNGIYEMI
jgi:hypothetical protein